MGCLQGIFHRLHSVAHRCLQTSLVESANETVAVLGVHDSLDARAQHLYAIFLQHSRLVKLGSAVQRCLAAKRQEDTVGALLLDDLRHKMCRHGLEIHFVGNAFRRLNGGNVRVHENTLDALFTQSLQGLRTRVVEFTCLANLQGTATQHEYLRKFLVHHLIFCLLSLSGCKGTKKRGQDKRNYVFSFLKSFRTFNLLVLTCFYCWIIIKTEVFLVQITK